MAVPQHAWVSNGKDHARPGRTDSVFSFDPMRPSNQHRRQRRLRYHRFSLFLLHCSIWLYCWISVAGRIYAENQAQSGSQSGEVMLQLIAAY